MSSKITTLKKPAALNPDAVRAFAEGDQGKAKAVPKATGQKSGQVPEGDIRLTANIRADLHLKLKIEAAKQRTTVGELIERLIDGM